MDRINRKYEWETEKNLKEKTLDSVRSFANNKILDLKQLPKVLEKIIKPYNRVLLEGDNQKQADTLVKALNEVDPTTVNNLHLIIPNIQLKEHIELFNKGIASKVDFAYSGGTSTEIAAMAGEGALNIGNIHTYIELYARLFTDLTPDICLIAADEGDEFGNLYTGPNTEDTPILVESCSFKNKIVIAQVNHIVQSVSRVDIPGQWVDFIVETEKPYEINPIFTKDPAKITNEQILMAMMVIKGIYAKYGVKRLNHGIGYNTAAIELLLPTYGEKLGLRGEICTHWVLNPNPTIIPAIESGWVEKIMAFGSELGMEDYIRHRSDIFYTGIDGSLRSNRAISQLAGLYAIDLFIGATLQMDKDGNSSTVTKKRITGFGGAPNMGSNPAGRRHTNKPWNSMAKFHKGRGRKLCVQMVKTKTKKGDAFVERLDAVEMKDKMKFDEAPIMLYGDDLTHIVTEIGIGNLYMAETLQERRDIISSVAGDTEIGSRVSKSRIEELRKFGKVVLPEDLNIEQEKADRTLLAAKSFDELIQWSDGLYKLPDTFVK